MCVFLLVKFSVFCDNEGFYVVLSYCFTDVCSPLFSYNTLKSVNVILSDTLDFLRSFHLSCDHKFRLSELNEDLAEN